MHAFDIRAPHPATPAGSLSGGNQQKMVIARECSRPLILLIAAQPTRGLDVGADDYLVKPFAFGELLARLRALLRRGPVERAPTLSVGDVTLDPASRLVTRAGIPVELSSREFSLLEFLMRHQDQVGS